MAGPIFTPRKDGHTDVSVVGWQIQALKACSHTNIKYKGMNSMHQQGLELSQRLQNENGGFGYVAQKAGG